MANLWREKMSSLLEASNPHHDQSHATLRILVILALSTVLYTTIRAVYLVFFHPLSRVPGPFLAKLTDLWQFYYVARLLKAVKIQETHIRYGDVVRIGPNELSFSNPGEMKAIYGHGVGVLKTDFYIGGSFTGEHNLFTMKIREQHSARRKLMSRNFAQAPLMELVPSFMKKAHTLCTQLEKRGRDGRTVNVYPWVHRLGLEFILMQILGHDPKLTENDTHHPVLRNLEIWPPTVAWTSIFPSLKTHGKGVPIAYINTPFRVCQNWNAFCMNVVKEEREKKTADKSPWILRMTESKDEWLGRPLTDLEISEEIIGNLFAGSGTTSSTLAFLLYAVTADRVIYNKLKSELRQAFPDWPNNEDLLPAIDVVQQLPYLNAVISETLRRYPTIPGAMPRRVVADNLKVGDLLVPKGTVISAQNYSVHMNKEYFPSPETYDPERFLGADSQRAKQGLNPFSEGPRGCIGRNLAQLELQIVTALFFRYFEVELAPDMDPAYMEMAAIFTGSPRGEKVLLSLKKDHS